MADMEDRTEEATPRKREDARKEGRVPRSQELTTAVLFLEDILEELVGEVQDATRRLR